MFLQKGIVITVVILILMTRLKLTNGRIHEGKYKNHRDVNKLTYQSLQTRHYNHYLHKKHHKCNLERLHYRQAQAKKMSRYPTLDKIVHRLDNRVDHVDKMKMRISESFDEWNISNPVTTAPLDKTDIYTYYTVGLTNGASVKSVDKIFDGNLSEKNFRVENTEFKKSSAYDEGSGGGSGGGDYDSDGFRNFIREKILNNSNGDPDIGDHHNKYTETNTTTTTTTTVATTTTSSTTTTTATSAFTNSYSKGFMQDHTTSSPWENEQHDISSRAGGSSDFGDFNTSYTSSTSSTPLSHLPDENGKKDLNLGKLPFWSISRLVPRVTDGEEKKKQTTPMPYVAAHEHYEQVLRMGDCHIPKEKVIRVHEVHPDPSKSYSPSCTILHQCGDDTGCCRDLKQVCKPKNTTKVELYFFTTTLGKPQTVEKLHFVNHTECECQRRTDEAMPRDAEFRRHRGRKNNISKSGEDKKKRKNCLCPSKYSARHFHNESCICDCFDKQDDCLVLKKGKAHFSYNDKLCIQQGTCVLPSCEFGSYIRRYGRCPNRAEKYHFNWSRVLSYRDLIAR